MTPQSDSAPVPDATVIAIYFVFVRKAVLEENLGFSG
jgi:hypothetical protein